MLGKYWQNESRLIDREIRKAIVGEPKTLYGAAYYLPSIGGKRMRPFLTVLAGKLFGRIDRATYLAGVGVELLHSFTLIHDDIMDKDSLRRGNPTVHKKYGLPTAILASDMLFSKAFEVGAEAESLAGVTGLTRLLSNASIRIAEGQFFDMAFEKRKEVGVGEYLKMIDLKTGALFECATEAGGAIGAMKGGIRRTATKAESDALVAYACNLGLAFQIHDDYLGTFGDPAKTKKPVGSDLRRGKKTYVVLAALQRASSEQLKTLGRVLGNVNAEEGDVKIALGELRDMRIDFECHKITNHYTDEAVRSLTPLPDGQSKELLGELAQYAATREN
jgi:geranylgeranyl diphosphate synthase type I